MSKVKTSYQFISFAYFWQKRLFPKQSRDDVYKLYSFLTVVDDAVQNDPKQFNVICRRWQSIKKDIKKGTLPSPLDDSAREHALANIAYVMHHFSCDVSWVDAYLKSKHQDMQKHRYQSLKDTLGYIYGRYEVIGLLIVRILNMPEEALKPARLQARAFGYMHMLRDISHDAEKGICYFPQSEYKKYGLKDLTESEARTKPKMFTDFMHAELLRYATWQAEANKGFYFLPRRLSVSLHAAVDTYNWIAQQLKNDPLLVYDSSFRPKRRKVAKNFVSRVLHKGN